MKKNQRINDYFIVKHPVECTHHAHTHTHGGKDLSENNREAQPSIL